MKRTDRSLDAPRSPLYRRAAQKERPSGLFFNFKKVSIAVGP